MKAPSVEPAVTPDLVTLLDTHLARVVSEHGAIPSTIWERALIGIARELLNRPGKQVRARLVELSFELAGGERGALSPRVAQLVELVHAGSLIIDDIQDNSMERRGGPAIHRTYGTPRAINTGTWLYFAAYHLIDCAGFTDRTALEIQRRLTRMMFRSHQGQALDLALDVTALRQRDIPTLAEGVAVFKSGELMSFAAALGGTVADASAATLVALARFGSALGVALQHIDDASGLRGRRDKGREDLAGRRVTWPWACLATQLDELRFAKLQRTLREARPHELEPVLDELAGLVGERAQQDACSMLECARTKLVAAFSRPPGARRGRCRARESGEWLCLEQRS